MNQLAPTELQHLEELEKVVENGILTFVDVGLALMEIRDKRLYRQSFNTFEQYVRDRWNMSHQHAYRLIKAYGIVENLQVGDGTTPVSEREIRPLSRLEPQQQREVWRAAVASAPNNAPTAGHVQRLVDEMYPKPPIVIPPSQTESDIDHAIPYDDTVDVGETTAEQSHTVMTLFKRPKSHTANMKPQDKFHAKLMWNYERLAQKGFFDNVLLQFTISYELRTIEQFLEIIVLANVDVLVDTRANTSSIYKPDFSKSSLESSCTENGIDYIHVPSLGIPAGERADLAETQDYDSLWDHYCERIDIDQVRHQIDIAGYGLRSDKLAFLCLEMDPNTCHRHLIAQMLEDNGLQTFDL